MDNTLLQQLIADQKERQFWIKPIGDPSNPPQPGLSFTASVLRIDFAKAPLSVQMDDILIVYAVGQSKLLYIADKYTPHREATEAEKLQEEWRRRWSWSFRGHNYTPTYGNKWWEYNLRPFDILKEYNSIYPEDKHSLGTIQRGQDKHRISRQFAMFIIKKVIEL